MKDRLLDMQDLITQKDAHLLWRDDCGDDFLLLPWCEIIVRGNDRLGVYVFFYKKLLRLGKRGVILKENGTKVHF